MKTSGYIALAAFSLIAGLTSCNGPEKAKTTDLSFEKVELSQAYRMVNSAEIYGADSDIVIACRAKMLLPTEIFGNDASELQDSIFARTFGKKDFNKEKRDLTALVDDYFKDYVEEYGLESEVLETNDTDSADFLTKYDGFTGIRVTPMTVSSKFLSFQMLATGYAPRAAHGMYTTQYLTYDIAAGKVVDLEDLITPEGFEALPELLKKRSRALEHAIGPTDVTGLPANNNFFINSENEFVFGYQPYEIASYSQGEIRLAVPAYLLTPYLTLTAKKILF